MKGALAVGLMSGTSADGVSAVLVSFQKKTFRILAFQTWPYPSGISKKIERSLKLTAPEISSLNFELGEFFSKRVLLLLKKEKISPEKISVIGSHGQTLVHAPGGEPPSTLQIGESSVIAERTGIMVVSDFRPRDMAAGGQGAPLIPFFDQYFFGDGPIRALQNIGGIANVTVVGKKLNEPIAFDTGPGNCLIDWAVKKVSGGRILYDRGGKMARKGRVIFEAVEMMASHPYFRRAPPKSTGKELFNESFIPETIKRRLENFPADVLNTLTYFTAYSIFQSYKRFVLSRTGLKEVQVSGGGAFNRTLMSHLSSLFSPIPVSSIEKIDVHPQAKEPAAFAFFALRAIQGKANHCPSGTGAKHSRVLGKITPGNYFRGLK